MTKYGLNAAFVHLGRLAKTQKRLVRSQHWGAHGVDVLQGSVKVGGEYLFSVSLEIVAFVK